MVLEKIFKIQYFILSLFLERERERERERGRGIWT